MSFKRWMDNAFWEDPQKEQLNCILEIQDDIGRETTQVMRLNRLDKDGSPNEIYNEVVAALGEELIDKNTEERKVRKAAEHE